ncbi:MAG TPA: prenyltransferase/squalene oxidase repeat-containing protein [Planctomycetota bacterium]|nr:prenyltransferase/squalene oxidase repeat-containing protein [Planctomycetota bacterium]
MKATRTWFFVTGVFALALASFASPRSEPVQEPSAGDASMLVVTPEQTRAVERGLQWLQSHQNEDGSWTAEIGYKLNVGYNTTERERGHVGVTSLAGMAFLAGGHVPGRGPYGEVVERALDFVLGSVQDDGYVTHAGSRMYSHAFATMFLAEICGMTERPDVRAKLQLAADFIVHSQNVDGGWRYEPYAVESDMSIVVCQVLALRAARNIGVRVPKAVIDKAARYVVDSAVTEGSTSRAFGRPINYQSEIGSFHYQKQDGSRSSFPLTAAGVTALHGVGIYSAESIDAGVHYLMANLDHFNRERGRSDGYHYFFWYGHYYAVQAMYTAGGPAWESYFESVRSEILSGQNSDGSWPNKVGPGPAFGTACATLILEIPYRFLPIFQR